MGYFDKLITSKAVIHEITELNYENEKSVEHRELAHQDLKAAKALAEGAKSNNDKGTKKALNRKAKQVAMETVEHAQKSVIYADENHQRIPNKDIYLKLEKTHNNSFLQKEQECAGINILEKEDIIELNSAIKKRNGEKSPYNAIRFTEQQIPDQAVDVAINVAKKAVSNLDKKVDENKGTRINIGNINVLLDM